MRTLIWYDLNYGYQSTRLKWLGAVLVQAYFVILACQCCSAPETPGGMLGHLSFLFRGMPEYFVSETGKFELPVPWLMLNACLLFLTVSYPAEDLTRSGGQAIVRAGRRRNWLLGKAAWVACTVAAYYLLLAAALALGALVTESAGMGDLATESTIIGSPVPERVAAESSAKKSAMPGDLPAESMAMGSPEPKSAVPEDLAAESAVLGNPSPERVATESPARKSAAPEDLAAGAPARGDFLGLRDFRDGLYGISPETLTGWEIFLRWWVQPILVSLTLCLTEMMLSLALEPAMALFLTLGYLTASVFWASPGFLGNFSMLLRQDFLSGNPAICFRNCLMLCGLWNAVVLFFGMRWIRRKDIF